MPVIREQRRVEAQTAGGGVVRPGESVARLWGEAAAAAASFAGQMGRLMAETTQDQAVALAAAVELDADFQPVFRGSPVARARMGALAGRAFDAQVLPRQAQALQSDLALMIDRIRDAHQYDSAGFAGAVAAAVEGMAGSIPEDLRGVFQDGARRQVEATASRIGWNEGQLIRQNEAEQFAVNGKRIEDEVWTLSQAGRHAEAAALAGTLQSQGEDLFERRIIGPADLERARRAVNGARGMGELMGEIDLEALDGPQLRALQERLTLGNDDALNAMFPDADDRVYAATRISALASQREGEARDVAAAEQTRYDTSLVIAGAAPPTGPNRDLLDGAIGQVVGFRPTPVDWVDGRVPQAEAWDLIRQSGMLPASLLQAFTIASNNGLSDAGAETAFRMWSAVTRGRGPDGAPVTLDAEIPEKASARFGLTELYIAGGAADFADAWRRAGETVAAPPDAGIVAARLNADRPWLFPRDKRGDFTAENVDGRIGTMLAARLEDDLGMPLDAREAAVAGRLFKALIADDAIPADEAYGLVRRSYDARLAETAYMARPGAGPVRRSAFAPEKFYSLPRERLPRGLVARPWFETWAEAQFRARADVDLPAGAILPGEHYRLVADERADAAPVYRAEWLSPEGFWEPALGRDGARLVLDPRADFAAAAAPARARDDAAETARLEAERARRRKPLNPRQRRPGQ